MKYIWITITTIFYISGWIATIYDIWDTYQYNKYRRSNRPIRELDQFTLGWIAMHFIILFGVSFFMWYAS